MYILTAYNTRSLTGAAQEFKLAHVLALKEQCAIYAPNVPFKCLSDVNIADVDCVPYKHGWPGWWIKLFAFSPDVPGDFLFMDLDTVIRGPLDDILAVKKLTVLRDFYRDGVKLKEGLGSGLIYLPESARKQVWDFWMTHPQWHQRMYPRGDQFLLERFWLNTAQRWQDVVPGQVVSWKVHCAKGVPPEARVIAFHGQPRPWSVGQFLHLYR